MLSAVVPIILQPREPLRRLLTTHLDLLENNTHETGAEAYDEDELTTLEVEEEKGFIQSHVLLNRTRLHFG